MTSGSAKGRGERLNGSDVEPGGGNAAGTTPVSSAERRVAHVPIWALAEARRRRLLDHPQGCGEPKAAPTLNARPLLRRPPSDELLRPWPGGPRRRRLGDER